MAKPRTSTAFSSFESFLRTNRLSLSQSPVVLISSEDNDDNNNKEAVNRVKFLATQAMGLRCVPATISSRFPTQVDLDSVRTLIRRSGATHVLGVGNKAAMDLTKLTVNDNNDNNDNDQQLLCHLLPTTQSALLHCSTTHSLFLSLEEETILCRPDNDPTSTTTVSIVVDKDSVKPSAHSQWAMQALKIDQQLIGQLDGDDEDAPSLENQQELLLLSMGSGLSFGTDDANPIRSPLVALAASLIPPVFSSVPIFTLWASLLPGLEAVAGLEPNYNAENVSSPPPPLASLALEPQPLDQLMQHVRSNRMAWNGVQDIDDELLFAILQKSLDR